MFSAIFWFSAGLIVGWNVLPQPTWVGHLYERANDKFNEFLDKSTKKD